MTFAELLKDYIGDRTLESVVAECKTRGIEMDRILLGRMRSGDRLPPGDESTIRVLAEVCGRDPGSLILLAKYQRNPQEVMEEVIDAFALADHHFLLLQDQARIPIAVLITRLQAGEVLSTAEILEVLTTEEPHVERLREAYDRYRDRAYRIVDLISDPFKAQYGRPGEKGTFQTHGPTTRSERLQELVIRLSEVAQVPERPLLVAIAAAKAACAPTANVGEILKSLGLGEPSGDD